MPAVTGSVRSHEQQAEDRDREECWLLQSASLDANSNYFKGNVVQQSDLQTGRSPEGASGPHRHGTLRPHTIHAKNFWLDKIYSSTNNCPI